MAGTADIASLNVTSGPFVSTGASYLNETTIPAGKTLTVAGTADIASLNVTSGPFVSTGDSYLNDTTIPTGKTLTVAGTTVLAANQIDSVELAAQPHMTVDNTTNMTVGTTYSEVFNTSDMSKTIDLERTSTLIITYTANVTSASAAGTFVKCNITNTTTFTTVYATPYENVRIADNSNVKVRNTQVFFRDSLGAGTYYVNVSAMDANGGYIEGQTLTVIAIPA